MRQHNSRQRVQTSENLSLLLHAVEGINRTFELKDLLKKCMNAARIVMNSEASSLMLLDEVSDELNVSIPTGPVQDDIVGLSIPSDKGIGGWVLNNNQPYISNNVQESEYFWKDLSEAFKTRNVICIPLKKTTGEAFGVLQAINKKNGLSFTEDDIYVFESLGLHVSIAIERAKQYDRMVNNLEDYKIQLSEIHHRLKNNLATINALIELDLSDLPEGKPKETLKVTSTRVRSVAEVHSLLYNNEEFGKIELSQYLNSILDNVEKIFNDPEKDIRLEKDLEEVFVNTSNAMLCGLMVNELVINSYQHAFKDRKKGKISLTLREDEQHKKYIHVEDDGAGFDKDRPVKEDSRGMYIINALSSKLEAELQVDSQVDKGFSCSFIFE